MWWAIGGAAAAVVGGAVWALDQLSRMNRELLPGDPYAEIGARPSGAADVQLGNGRVDHTPVEEPGQPRRAHQ